MHILLRLGSLFSGSGGFELAGVMHGVEPVWASEIEPFPIRVTKNRFPHMKHLGSVTDVNGAEVEPVDIITFGSPCQDLSVAGKQKGIHDGERSNLFFEAIRIIKEMRNATANEFPRFAVWENVPGAFSSNGGDDFKAVIEAFCSVCQPDVSIPRSEGGGVWQPAGCVLGDGYSLAWRVYDAQYWGVPQRRKRIYLIADFRSERAGEILFEQDGVSGDSEPSKAPWQRTAGDAEGSAGGSSGDRLNVIKDREGNGHGGKGLMSDANTAYTVQTNCEQSLVYESGAFYGNAGSTRPIDFIGGGTPPVKHSSTVHVVMKKSTV